MNLTSSCRNTSSPLVQWSQTWMLPVKLSERVIFLCALANSAIESIILLVMVISLVMKNYINESKNRASYIDAGISYLKISIFKLRTTRIMFTSLTAWKYWFHTAVLRVYLYRLRFIINYDAIRDFTWHISTVQFFSDR